MDDGDWAAAEETTAEDALVFWHDEEEDLDPEDHLPIAKAHSDAEEGEEPQHVPASPDNARPAEGLSSSPSKGPDKDDATAREPTSPVVRIRTDSSDPPPPRAFKEQDTPIPSPQPPPKRAYKSLSARSGPASKHTPAYSAHEVETLSVAHPGSSAKKAAEHLLAPGSSSLSVQQAGASDSDEEEEEIVDKEEILSSRSLNKKLRETRDVLWLNCPEPDDSMSVHFEMGHSDEDLFRIPVVSAIEARIASLTVGKAMAQGREITQIYNPSPRAKRGVRGFVLHPPPPAVYSGPSRVPTASIPQRKASSQGEPSAKKPRLVHPTKTGSGSGKEAAGKAKSPPVTVTSSRRPVRAPERFHDQDFIGPGTGRERRRSSDPGHTPSGSESPPPNSAEVGPSPTPPPSTTSTPPPAAEPEKEEDEIQELGVFPKPQSQTRKSRGPKAGAQSGRGRGGRRPRSDYLMSEERDEPWMVEEGLERLQSLIAAKFVGDMPEDRLLELAQNRIRVMKEELSRQKLLVVNLTKSQATLFARFARNVVDIAAQQDPNHLPHSITPNTTHFS